MELKCRQADLQNSHDQQIILLLLNDFSIASASAKPLPDEVQATLLDNLAHHPTTVVYLAEYAWKPIGIAVCFAGFSTFANRPLLNIHDFYISAAFQGRGFGKAFLSWIEQEAKGQGYCKITLEVYAKNVRAKTLYERHGYCGSQSEHPEHLMYALSKTL